MKNMKKEYVILVDENDVERGTMEKMEAHEKALLHRAISVLIVDPEGKWLLQQRAKHKYHSNSLWTNACCTHPFPGETSLDAAHRRLKEEMGMQTELSELFHFIYKAPLDSQLTEYELDHVFVGCTGQEPLMNPDEAMDWKYISHKELKSDLASNPENYTVWFKKIVKHLEENLIETLC